MMRTTLLPIVLVLGAFALASGPLAQQAATPTSAAKGTVLITGANRGIGLALAKEFKSKGYDVIGTARTPDEAKDLKDTGATVMQLDVTDVKSIQALATALKDRKIDILVNNAGISGKSGSIATIDIDALEKTLMVNVLGPMRVTQALLPNVKAGSRKTIVNITSILGSISNNTGGSYYGYRESKAALNMFTRSIAAELKGDGFTCIAMHPGWVRTDMGGPNATLSPEDSASGIVKVVEGLKQADSGGYVQWDGKKLEW